MNAIVKENPHSHQGESVQNHIEKFPHDEPAFMDIRTLMEWIDGETGDNKDYLIGALIGRIIMLSIENLEIAIVFITSIKSEQVRNICEAAINSRVLLSKGN